MRIAARFFVSSAEKDSRLVDLLLAELLDHFRASRSFDYGVWDFHQLLVGERWHGRIQEELAGADFGLLCLSPAFLASDYILREELPALLKRDRVVPLGLKPLDFARHEWAGLRDLQLFRLRTRAQVLRCYSQCRGPQRDAFVLELFKQIEGRLAAVGPK